MKSLAILLFSITLFAQNPYPDTLFLMDGRSFPCLITGVSESDFRLLYLNNIKETIINQAVKKLSMENYGDVYTSQEGFLVDINTLNEYANERFRKTEQEMTAIEESKLLNTNERIDRLDETFYVAPGNSSCKNRWSFGILYIPYYSGKIYTINYVSTYPPYYIDIFASAINEINMEAQLSYAVMDELRFTLDITYTSTNYERRTENQYRYNPPSTNYNSGTLIKENISLFDFSLGFKYYIKNIMAERVSIYFLAGAGQQIASAEVKDETLYQEPIPGLISDDNESEFTEDSNSPFHFNIGFGAEYFFNESLSLTSNIRFIYSNIKATYNSKTISDYETRTNRVEFKRSDFLTRVGLGLNFYF